MSLEKIFQQINAQYPWAKDATLDDLLTLMSVDIKNKSKIIIEANKESSQVPDSISGFQKFYGKYVTNATRFVKQSRTVLGKAKTELTRDVNPISSFAGLTEVAAGGLQRTGQGIQGLTSGMSQYFPALGRVTELSGAGLGLFTGTMGIYGQLMLEQEKVLRAMIDYGLVAGDLSLYTDMRNNFAYFGMSLNEGMQNFSDMIPIFAQLGDNNINTLGQFTGLIGTMIQDRSIQRFGRTRQGVLRAISNEVSTLQKLNMINSLSGQDLDRVIDRYDNSNRVLLAIASQMGIQRDTLEQRREEAINDIDFQAAMLLNQSEIIDRIGEEGYAFLAEARQSISSSFTTALGDDFGRLVSQALDRAIYDYSKDTEFFNNIGEDLNEVLNLLGPEIREEFMSIMQGVLDGGIDTAELERRKLSFFQALRNNQDTSPITSQKFLPNMGNVGIAREVMNNAMLVSEEYISMNAEQFNGLLESIPSLTEDADDVIEAVDATAATIRHAYDLMAPGFELAAPALNSFKNMISLFRDGIVEVNQALGIRLIDTNPDSIEQLSEAAGSTPRGPGISTESRRLSDQELTEMFDNYSLAPFPGSPVTNTQPYTRGPGVNNSLLVQQLTTDAGGHYGVNVTDSMNPLFTTDGAQSRLTREGAQENMERLLRGPYARMQELFGGAVPINDAIAKSGTSRESDTQNSQHFFGSALDLGIHGFNNDEKRRLVVAALNAGFTGFGFGNSILHVDVGPNRFWDYGISSFAGIPVSQWFSYVTGGPIPTQVGNVELSELISDFAPILPTRERYEEALSRRAEIFARIDELDTDVDGEVDDPQYQDEFNQLMRENYDLTRTVVQPYQASIEQQTGELGVETDLESFSDPEEEAAYEAYAQLLEQLRQQSEELDVPVPEPETTE